MHFRMVLMRLLSLRGSSTAIHGNGSGETLVCGAEEELQTETPTEEPTKVGLLPLSRLAAD